MTMNSVVHFEIPADDEKRAQDFYSKVFGWEIMKVPGDMPYYMLTTAPTGEDRMIKEPGAINGGMYKRKDNEPPVIVIDVKSIDEHIKMVKDAGGSIVMEKKDIGDMGFYARIKDSEGNVIGIWEDSK